MRFNVAWAVAHNRLSLNGYIGLTCDAAHKQLKYLVTGGYGFVGSHLVERLVRHGHEVTVLDNLSNGQLDNLDAVRRDITSYLSNVEQIQTTFFNTKFDGI